MPLLAALAVCALYSVAAGQAGPAARRADGGDKPNAQELYDAAKSSYEAEAYGEALEKLEELLKATPDHAPALYLKYRSLMGLFAEAPPLTPAEKSSPETSREKRAAQAGLLKQAAESLERYLSLNPEADALLRDQLAALRVLAEPATRPESGRTFLFAEEVTEKAKILHKPEPMMPESLRGTAVKGRVRVLVVLGADGNVGQILVVKTSGRSMTFASIAAARRIRFEPATKDGKPVSTVVLLEYGFEVY